MVHKLCQVLEEFNPKIHNVSLTKQQTKCIKLFKKGDMIKPRTMIAELKAEVNQLKKSKN